LSFLRQEAVLFQKQLPAIEMKPLSPDFSEKIVLKSSRLAIFL
jgi:hypothetical protein